MKYLLSEPQNQRHKRHIRHGAMTHPSQVSQSVIKNPMKSEGMTLVTLMTDKFGLSEKGVANIMSSVMQVSRGAKVWSMEMVNWQTCTRALIVSRMIDGSSFALEVGRPPRKT
ncbi:hypothetical protein CLV76_12171 [Marivita geojedonensis]|nr:hypothetical protein CLV76_12171 [Marivita geojedonensis]